MVLGPLGMAAIVLVIVGITIYLVGTMIRSIHDETRSTDVRAFKHFGLSIVLCLLFFLSWAGQGFAQWQAFTDAPRAHKQPVTVGDFASNFAESTLQNWQSEFLQLFSFVVLSALLIHRGSAESKDSDDRVEEALARIERRLDELQGESTGR
jgi:Na+-transporting methylmalonyl-CoA/oxaloacetate decarboxylase gamma subunit